MKIYLKIILFLGILSSIYCQEKIAVNTDYSPLNAAYDSVRQIQIRYDNYKNVIHKNVSIEYFKCKEIIKNMQCNNADQWQSVIEELKQENDNSENAEIPFLIERKKKKVEKFANVLNKSETETEGFKNLSAHLQENQQKIMDAFYFIEEMYKLPKEQQSDFVQLNSKQDNSTEEEQSTQSAAQILNQDVPDLAKEQLNIAKKEYDIADQSIQAQTASNILKALNKKMAETLGHVNDAYNARSSALQQKKELLQGDILKVRVMVQNEMNKQAKNNEKIDTLQAKIDQCQNMPTDELKDCNPIKVNASKILTEIEIIQARTDLLNKHIEDAVEENLSKEQVQQHLQNIADAKGQAAKQAQIDAYLKDPEVQYFEPKTPNELHPIHHLKDNLPQEEEQQQEVQQTQQAEQEEKVTR